MHEKHRKPPAMKIWIAATATLVLVSLLMAGLGYVGDAARAELRKQHPDKVIPDSRLPGVAAAGLIVAGFSAFLLLLAVLWRWAT